MKTSLPYQFLAVWMSLVCYLSPIYLFTDAHLLPKWYLCLVGLAVTGVLVAVAGWHGKRKVMHGEVWDFICKVFTLTTALECLWVVVCIMRDGLRQGGEVGTLGNPVELALHLCVVLPMTARLAWHSKGWCWRVVYGMAVVLFTGVLWFTQSRTGLICLALDGIVGLWMWMRRSVHRRCLRWGLHGAVVVAVLPAFIIRRLPVRYTFDNNYFNDTYQGVPIGGYNKLINGLLEGVDTQIGVDFFDGMDRTWREMADTLVYTGKIDDFYHQKLGRLQYRSLRFETEVLDVANYQGGHS